MKKAAYAITFVALSLIFVMAYYCCYFYATNNSKSDKIRTIYDDMNENPVLDNDYTDAGKSDEDIVNDKTRYVLEIYDVNSKTITTQEREIPIEFLGLDRTAMIEYISEYSKEDEDGSIINVQLVSFSESCIVIRKSIDKEKDDNYNYWVIDESGIVKVYKQDKKELYLDTGIESASLEKEDKKMLRSGVYIEDIKALYNYLESITSWWIKIRMVKYD